jgi:hypothetical protein
MFRAYAFPLALVGSCPIPNLISAHGFMDTGTWRIAAVQATPAAKKIIIGES